MRIVDSTLMANILILNNKKIFFVLIAKCFSGKLWITRIIIWLRLLELEKKDYLCNEHGFDNKILFVILFIWFEKFFAITTIFTSKYYNFNINH